MTQTVRGCGEPTLGFQAAPWDGLRPCKEMLLAAGRCGSHPCKSIQPMDSPFSVDSGRALGSVRLKCPHEITCFGVLFA
jgi:hypothetical protein